MNRFSQWLAHHPITSVVALAAVDTYRELSLATQSWWMDRAQTAVVAALLVTVIYAIRDHRFKFCATCFQQSEPGPDEGERRVFSLQLFHWVDAWRWFVAGGFVLVALLAAWLIPHGIPVAVAGVVVYATIGCIGRSICTHCRLVPQCPWCKDNGDDDGESEDTPVPDPVGTKTTSLT